MQEFLNKNLLVIFNKISLSQVSGLYKCNKQPRK